MLNWQKYRSTTNDLSLEVSVYSILLKQPKKSIESETLKKCVTPIK